MDFLGRELQQAVVSQGYGLCSGSIYFQPEDTSLSACSYLRVDMSPCSQQQGH